VTEVHNRASSSVLWEDAAVGILGDAMSLGRIFKRDVSQQLIW